MRKCGESFTNPSSAFHIDSYDIFYLTKWRNKNGTENCRAVIERREKLQNHNKDGVKASHFSYCALPKVPAAHALFMHLDMFAHHRLRNVFRDLTPRIFFNDAGVDRKRSVILCFIRIRTIDVTSTGEGIFIA